MSHKTGSIIYALLSIAVQLATVGITIRQHTDVKESENIFLFIYVCSGLTIIICIVMLITACSDSMSGKEELVALILAIILQFAIASAEVIVIEAW